MRVPNEFIHPLFFQAGDVISIEEAVSFPYMMKKVYFYYDIYDEALPSAEQPWKQIESSIPAVLELWKEEKEKLEGLFLKRDRKAAKAPMIRALSFFLSSLFWLNEKPVTRLIDWGKEVNALLIKPINCVERLQFIFTKCDLYHSFIQLSELFDELTKLYYKTLAIKKKSPQ